MLQLITSLLQFQNEFVEALVDVARLLVAEALDLGLDVVYELPVVVVDALGIDHELVQVVDILLDDVGHILKLCQLMTIMISKHALGTDDGVAEFAKVLNLLVEMLEAVDLAVLLLAERCRCL